MARPPKTKEIFKRTDEAGNTLTVEETVSGDMYIYIHIDGERKRRNIGYVEKATKRFNVERKRHMHLHRKSQSYGFNEYVIKNAKLFESVMLKDEHGVYLIPVPVILEHGKYMYYKEQGFEKQLFIPLELIVQYKQNAIF